MESPSIPLGQYLRFLMSAAEKTPNPQKAVVPFDTQS